MKLLKVFALRGFAPGEVVELCPGLVLAKKTADEAFPDYVMGFDEADDHGQPRSAALL